MKEIIPSRVICKNSPEKSFKLNINEDELYFNLSYKTELHNHKGLVGEKNYSLSLSKYIRRNRETFEVLGLLQAEMGKQHDGKIVFCNHEYQLVNKVMKWFEEEFGFSKDKWKWYIKVNINEPLDLNYKKEVEDKVINYWIEKVGLSLERSYFKKVSYIKDTKHTKLSFDDYGTLIIEKGTNLFSQIIKILVKNMSKNILNYEKSEIRHFMKAIIAGESNVEFNSKSGHYRIFISAKNFEERKLYQNCLNKLGIKSTVYLNFHGVVISKRENNLKLLKQRLMTLSPEKYDKFLQMMESYSDLNVLEILQFT